MIFLYKTNDSPKPVVCLENTISCGGRISPEGSVTMLRIWTGIILFLNLAAVFANKDDVSFTSGKPWGEYTGKFVIKIKKIQIY
jgi:hypothetical protein